MSIHDNNEQRLVNEFEESLSGGDTIINREWFIVDHLECLGKGDIVVENKRRGAHIIIEFKYLNGNNDNKRQRYVEHQAQRYAYYWKLMNFNKRVYYGIYTNRTNGVEILNEVPNDRNEIYLYIILDILGRWNIMYNHLDIRNADKYSNFSIC